MREHLHAVRKNRRSRSPLRRNARRPLRGSRRDTVPEMSVVPRAGVAATTTSPAATASAIAVARMALSSGTPRLRCMRCAPCVSAQVTATATAAGVDRPCASMTCALMRSHEPDWMMSRHRRSMTGGIIQRLGGHHGITGVQEPDRIGRSTQIASAVDHRNAPAHISHGRVTVRSSKPALAQLVKRVRPRHGMWSMSDHQPRAIREMPIDEVVHGARRHGIEVARRLIQHQHGGFTQAALARPQYAAADLSKGPLLLSRSRSHSPAAACSTNESTPARAAASRTASVGCVEMTVAQVVIDAGAKHGRLGLQHRDVPAQRIAAR